MMWIMDVRIQQSGLVAAETPLVVANQLQSLCTTEPFFDAGVRHFWLSVGLVGTWHQSSSAFCTACKFSPVRVLVC